LIVAVDRKLSGLSRPECSRRFGNIAFQPHVVEESVGEFIRSFIEALIIVLVVSFLSLGFRAGIVVALSVPLVLSISLVVMNAIGMNLDRKSLGALLLALGLLVDDAIIAVEMMAVKMEEGWSRVNAATFAWTSTAFPMLSGTLITVVGFLPVGFARSAAGEYAGLRATSEPARLDFFSPSIPICQTQVLRSLLFRQRVSLPANRFERS